MIWLKAVIIKLKFYSSFDFNKIIKLIIFMKGD